MLPSLALTLVLASAPAEPADWPAPWQDTLVRHFGETRPVRMPDDLLDQVVERWIRELPDTLGVMLDPLWQGADVYLIDAPALARVHSRVLLHSIFPFAGVDARGRPFAMQAALLGRGRLAFIYERELVVRNPDYRVFERDDFSLGALNLATLDKTGVVGLRGFRRSGTPIPIEGPFGANIEGFVREEARIRVKLRLLPDRYIRPRQVTPVVEQRAAR